LIENATQRPSCEWLKTDYNRPEELGLDISLAKTRVLGYRFVPAENSPACGYVRLNCLSNSSRLKNNAVGRPCGQ
jgi:hypothetical protein